MRYTTRIIVPPRIRRSGPPGSPGGAYGPQVLGVRKTFGFGDRLGLATPGHLAVAAAHPDFAPVFAQQSAPELAAMGRAPADAVASAARGVGAARFRQPWGANADRLRTAQEVVSAAEAGYTYFTFDPSEIGRVGVEDLTPVELQQAVDTLVADGDLPEHWMEPYLNHTIDLPGGHQLRVALEPLQRAVVRYMPAVLHCTRLSSALARSNQGRPFEIEVALDAVGMPATTLEHLFIGLELEARGVRLTSLALNFGVRAGEEGSPEWERRLREHAAVAEFCGPYKLGFDEAWMSAGFYPVIARVCGEALHVKTSATSFLEALRTVLRVDPPLFHALVDVSLGRSAAEEGMRAALRAFPADAERLLLDEPAGRQCLDATFPTMVTLVQDATGRKFKDAILEVLEAHADLYVETLAAAFEQQFALLQAG